MEDAKNEDVYTALHTAAGKDAMDVLSYLIEGGKAKR